MGFLPSHLRMMIRSHRRNRFSGPVCTLGNQDTWATFADLLTYFEQEGCPPATVGSITRHMSRTFNESAELRAISAEFVHARVFFEMLGIREYADMDAFDFDSPTMRHDLNVPVPASLHGSFGLVVDGGTVEHVFDIRTALANIVAMLRPGGHVIHMASFEMDHGFYALSPGLFFDFYGANGFDDFECAILQFDYPSILKNYKDRVPYFEYRYNMPLAGLLNPKRQPAVYFVARKREDAYGVRIPTQGIYARRESGVPAIEVPDAGSRSLYDTVIPRALRRPLSPLRPIASALLRQLRRLRKPYRSLPKV